MKKYIISFQVQTSAELDKIYDMQMRQKIAEAIYNTIYPNGGLVRSLPIQQVQPTIYVRQQT